ncbi:MAG TPA: hypothetical protein VK689_21220, partial [Armatimonadota bacterium]|nr:hypothetical protein [Armatimonadota bacterium]
IGESAAHVALFCLDRNLSPQTLLESEHRRRRLQRRLVRAGIPLHWYVDVPLDHTAFEAVQTLGAWGLLPGDDDSLEFAPARRAGPEELRLLSQAPHWARDKMERLFEYWLPQWSSHNRETLAREVYSALSI